MAEIVTYRDEFRADFERLNREWIERYFGLEPPDLEVFRDPVGHIVRPGGQILFLLERGRVVGTCALLPHGPGVFELAKMAVDPAARGRGYGDLLLEAAIAHARAVGGRRLTLVSNTTLEAAIRLYRKHGFAEVPLADDSGYRRANIRMDLTLAET